MFLREWGIAGEQGGLAASGLIVLPAGQPDWLLAGPTPVVDGPKKSAHLTTNDNDNISVMM